MLSDNELWEKCSGNDPITSEDLGVSPVHDKCSLVVYCGSRTFYTDGKDYYNDKGKKVSRVCRIMHGLF